MGVVIGKGIYEVPEAARLISVNPAQLRRWVRPAGADGSSLIQLDYAKEDGRVAMSFHDLVETFIIARMLERGIKYSTIRKARHILAERFRTLHPLARQEIAVDRKSIYLLFRHDESECIEDVVEGQFEIPEVVSHFLDRIEYGPDRLALRWRWNDRIVIDPARRFGAPMVDRVGITTEVLDREYQANDRDADLVARWWEVDVDDVMAAVAFEDELRRRAA